MLTPQNPPPPRRRVRLLYVGDAALARECLGKPGGSIEVVAAAPPPGRRLEALPLDPQAGSAQRFDILLVEHGYPGVETLEILKDLTARHVHVPVVVVADWDEELAVLALRLGASDYVVKSRASFRAVYFRLHRLIAHAALLAEQPRIREAHATTLDRERSQHEHFARQIAEAQTARRRAEQLLQEAAGAIKQARQDRLADAVMAAHEQARQESAFAAALAGATAAAKRIEQQLARETELRRTGQRAAATHQAAAADFARRHAEVEAALTEEAARLRAVETKLAFAQMSHEAAERRWMAEATTSADKAAQREEELTKEIAQVVRARDALEQRLNEAATALRASEQRAAGELEAAREHAAERERQIEAELARETANRKTVEEELSDLTIALQRSEARHGVEVAAADARIAEQEARYDARLFEAAAAHDALQSRLAATEERLTAAHRDAAAERQRASAEAARLLDRQHEADRWLAEAAAVANGLETALIDTTAALERAEATLEAADRQAAAEREAAAAEAAHRIRTEAELRDEITRRQAVEQELAVTQVTSEHARRVLLETEARNRNLQSDVDDARAWLVTTEEHVRRLEADRTQERASFEGARAALESDLARLREEYSQLQQTLEHARASAEETIESAARARAAERAELEALVADRNTRLQEQAVRQQASDLEAAHALADVARRLELSLAAQEDDGRAIVRLQEQVTALTLQLDATRGQREGFKTTAERVPQLEKQMEAMRAQHRRQFDRIPSSLFRCTRDGTVLQVNHAVSDLLGYDSPDDVEAKSFVASVFEDAEDLAWVVDRCLATSSTESVETTWKRRDGSRIIVRLQAVATGADSVDLAVEDVSRFRVLEERLRNAQRMEAVARYGSEVAVTCDTLLRHVKDEGQEWLAGIDNDAARHQGELLLDEVTRAAGFLRHLAVYGNEQKNVPDLVDLVALLRDMGPVMKRVAGDNIELVLPKSSTPLHLDVEAPRVERMLVNVAAYGRERMPLGGRLMIDVASTVVDRTFVAKHPNVRPGAHVLLTVHERRGDARPRFPYWAHGASGGNALPAVSENPGVDLGALQALVGDCGGHLWLMAEPQGDMLLKIHLPRRALDRLDPDASSKRRRRPRWLRRPFGVAH